MRFSAHAGTVVICFAVLLGAACIYQRVANPSLEYTLDTPQTVPNDHEHPPLAPEDAKALGNLMEELRAKPDDSEIVLRIVALFMRNNDWINAAAFLEKAAELTPENNRVWHLFGFVRSQQGQYRQAAEAFEKSVAISAEPQSMFSLGVMYRYHLNQEQKALAQFIAVKNSAKSDTALREKAEQEIFSISGGK